MIHVAVVEDEEKYREQLSEFLSRYGKEKGISIQTRIYCDGIDILDESIDEINNIVNTVKKGERLEGKEFTNGNLNREI